jgi:hypothetical protein
MEGDGADSVSLLSQKSAASSVVGDNSISDSKWLEKPQPFDNVLATSNVMHIGSTSKLPKTKFTDVFLPEGVCMEPPLISNDLLEKMRQSSSAPNLRSRTTGALDDMSIVSNSSRKLKKGASKREDPLAASNKVRFSQNSLSTINLRAKDSKTEKILRRMQQTCPK